MASRGWEGQRKWGRWQREWVWGGSICGQHVEHHLTGQEMDDGVGWAVQGEEESREGEEGETRERTGKR